ncbi:MAG TPA: hypothetical protein PK725_12575 [Rhodocyclaceae bacterium]|nr:hypothetical protein [Rhodocyclaceae bacterium]
MAGDANLTEILANARRALPDVPPAVWQQIESYLRAHYGTSRVYIEAHKKRRQLEEIERAGPGAEAQCLADMLGVSVRHARRLRNLR